MFAAGEILKTIQLAPEMRGGKCEYEGPGARTATYREGFAAIHEAAPPEGTKVVNMRAQGIAKGDWVTTYDGATGRVTLIRSTQAEGSKHCNTEVWVKVSGALHESNIHNVRPATAMEIKRAQLRQLAQDVYEKVSDTATKIIDAHPIFAVARYFRSDR